MDLFSFFLNFILNIDIYLGMIVQTLGNWTYLLLFLIVFGETGLVFLPFLPGDSLLFAAGSMAAVNILDVWLLLIVFSIAAILGDTANYWIGSFLDKKILKEKFLFFNKTHFEKAHAFYEKHGGKAIILGRFLPIIRTFVPFIAGIAQMEYKKFLLYNAIGGITWVGLFVFTGYLFGNIPIIQENFSLVITAIIVISLLPIIVSVLGHYLKNKK